MSRGQACHPRQRHAERSEMLAGYDGGLGQRRGVAYGGVFSQFSVDLNRFNAVRVLSTDPVTQVPTTVTERVIPV